MMFVDCFPAPRKRYCIACFPEHFTQVFPSARSLHFPFEPVGSFEAAGSVEAIQSFELVGSFEAIQSFEPVGSFEAIVTF